MCAAKYSVCNVIADIKAKTFSVKIKYHFSENYPITFVYVSN